MSTQKDLKGKVAFVTGSIRNLGKEIALDFARRGAHVVIHHHSAASTPEAQQMLEEVTSLGVESFLVQGDLDVENLASIYAKIVEIWGGLDILVNNAGTMVKKPIVEVT